MTSTSSIARDSMFAAIDRMMRKIEEILAQMDSAPAIVASVTSTVTSSSMSTASASIDTTMLISTTTREPLHTLPARCSTPGRSDGERALVPVAAAPPAPTSPTPAAAVTTGVVLTNAPSPPTAPISIDVNLAVGESTSSTKPVYSKPMVTPPTPSPSQRAPGSSCVEVTTKPSTSSTGAQKVFDKMAPQPDVFIGAAIDTMKHNHITVLSIAASSIVAGSAEEKGDYMLQDFLCVRDRRIDKASAKRLRYLKKFKHCASSMLDTQSPSCSIMFVLDELLAVQEPASLLGKSEQLLADSKFEHTMVIKPALVIEASSWCFGIDARNTFHQVCEKKDIKPKPPWPLTKLENEAHGDGKYASISLKLPDGYDIVWWHIREPILEKMLLKSTDLDSRGCQVLDPWKLKKAINIIMQSYSVQLRPIPWPSFNCRTLVLQSVMLYCSAKTSSVTSVQLLATEGPDNCKVLEIMTALNLAMPWPPPVQLEKLLSMVLSRSITKCKMKLINGAISELLMPSYRIGLLQYIVWQPQCDNCKTFMHGAYALCIQWKVPWPPPPTHRKFRNMLFKLWLLPECKIVISVSIGVDFSVDGTSEYWCSGASTELPLLLLYSVKTIDIAYIELQESVSTKVQLEEMGNWLASSKILFIRELSCRCQVKDAGKDSEIINKVFFDIVAEAMSVPVLRLSGTISSIKLQISYGDHSFFDRGKCTVIVTFVKSYKTEVNTSCYMYEEQVVSTESCMQDRQQLRQQQKGGGCMKLIPIKLLQLKWDSPS